MQAVLHEVGEELLQPTSVFHKSGKSQQRQLANLIDDCNTDLRDLERYLLQHKSLNTNKPRYWDRIRFGAKSTEGIRQKISRHTDGLNLFLTHVNTLSLSRIEQASESSTNILSDIVSKLDQLRQEVQTGRKDGSVFNVETDWSKLEQELVGQHITERDVVTNREPIKDHVMKWLDDVRDDEVNKTLRESSGSDTKRSSSMLPWCPDNAPMSRGDKRKGCHNILDLQEVAFLTSDTEEHERRDMRCASPTSFLSLSNTETISLVSEYSSRLESDQVTRITTPDASEFYEAENSLGHLEDQKALIDQLDAFLLEMSGTPSLKPTRTGSSISTTTGLQADGKAAHSPILDAASGYQSRRSITKALPLTLEEALFGCTKYEAVDESIYLIVENQAVDVRERTVEVVVPAGAHQGSCIGVPGIGVDADGTLQDLDFVVEWVSIPLISTSTFAPDKLVLLASFANNNNNHHKKSHHLYQLDGEHLVYTLEITLLESLCGWSRIVPTLDKEDVRVERQEVTPPHWSTVYSGRGMHKPNRPNARSNLVIKVNIKYPERVSNEQKKIFQSTFGSEA